jgi:hypothetical protein
MKTEIIFNPTINNFLDTEKAKNYGPWFKKYEPNALDANPPAFIKVPTSLDTRADIFGYWGVYDFLFNQEKYIR